MEFVIAKQSEIQKMVLLQELNGIAKMKFLYAINNIKQRILVIQK